MMGWLQICVYLLVIVLLAKPLGEYMARVFTGSPGALGRILGPAERLTYRMCGVRADSEMDWKQYARALLVFSLVGFVCVYVLQRVQQHLPFNPTGLGPVSADSAFNTAVSFVTNTNWQGYSGEQTLSASTQMLALCVQNFLSAASGIAILIAFARGVSRRSGTTLGNFWVDLTRATIYVLLPLALLLAIALVSQGVVQTFSGPIHAQLVQPLVDTNGKAVAEQLIAVGPAASQVAIKQLGTNGGGFFNANSAHPLENPTALSNFLEALAILLIPAALCFTYGALLQARRHGVALLVVMLVILVPCMAVVYSAESEGTPLLHATGIELSAGDDQPGGNMEGKELRNGIAASAIWSVSTTAASNGSVSSMHDSLTPLGGAIPMVLIQLGEVVFGGVGSGLYGLLLFVIVTVFIAGLMVGRTPEYLGKKIGAFEMQMASLGILVPCVVVLGGAAIAVSLADGRVGVGNPGPHAFSEILYAFSSAGNNNGSAFAGLSANTPFYNLSLGLAMFCARFFVAMPALAIAGAMVRKKVTPIGPGTLPTDDGLFVALLITVVILVGALTFVPSLALGPIVEHLISFQ